MGERWPGAERRELILEPWRFGRSWTLSSSEFVRPLKTSLSAVRDLEILPVFGHAPRVEVVSLSLVERLGE